jgi:hypothetical protein
MVFLAVKDTGSNVKKSNANQFPFVSCLKNGCDFKGDMKRKFLLLPLKEQ